MRDLGEAQPSEKATEQQPGWGSLHPQLQAAAWVFCTCGHTPQMGHFHFHDEVSVLPAFLIIGVDKVWVGKRRKLSMNGQGGLSWPLCGHLGDACLLPAPCHCPPPPPHRPGSWCLWGSGRWLWLLELGGLGDKELRRKRLQLEVVQERGVLGWSLLVTELLPSETIAISRVRRMEKFRDLPSFLSSHLPHFFLPPSYKY